MMTNLCHTKRRVQHIPLSMGTARTVMLNPPIPRVVRVPSPTTEPSECILEYTVHHYSTNITIYHYSTNNAIYHYSTNTIYHYSTNNTIYDYSTNNTIYDHSTNTIYHYSTNNTIYRYRTSNTIYQYSTNKRPPNWNWPFALDTYMTSSSWPLDWKEPSLQDPQSCTELTPGSENIM